MKTVDFSDKKRNERKVTAVKINGGTNSLKNFFRVKKEEFINVIFIMVSVDAIEHPIHSVIMREYQRESSFPPINCIKLATAISKYIALNK